VKSLSVTLRDKVRSCEISKDPEKTGEVSPTGYTQGKAVFGVKPTVLSEIAANREVFRALLRLLSRRPSLEERRCENE